MRVLVHAVGITRGGGLRHLAGLLPALAREPGELDAIVVTVRASVRSALGDLGPRVRFVTVPDAAGGSALARVAIDQGWVPDLCRSSGADVVVSFGNFGPILLDRPHVIFQTNALYFSDVAMDLAERARRPSLVARRALAMLGMRRAAIVVVPSRAMAGLVEQAIPWSASRVRVLHHGLDRGEFSSVRRSRSARFTFVCPGVAAFYKGLDVLVPALRELGDLDVVVRTFGRTSDWPRGLAEAKRTAERLGIARHLSWEDELDPSSVAGTFASADALVYPTHCESFGFTLLEALAMGMPVVASDLPVNLEIAGDAALTYPHHSSLSLGRAMRRVATEPALRAELSSRAERRVASLDWSWERYARELRAILSEARGRA